MAYTERPLQEKISLFWHGILTSSFKKTGDGPQTLQQNQLFRAEGMGRYSDLLKAVSRDPAMMIYLDSRSNKKAAPNENYSRELMELFSLGVGHYSEDDVRESARAFTGWQLRRKTEFFFNERQHDFGNKTFLGQTGDFDGDDIVDIIMAKPEAAEYVCGRLWRFFAYDDPEPAVVARLAAIFTAKNTEVRPVVRAIFESDEFYFRPRRRRVGEGARRARRGRRADPRDQHRFRHARPHHRGHGPNALRPSQRRRLAGRRRVDKQRCPPPAR